MAKIVLLSPQVSINSVDLSDHVSSVTISYEGDAQEVTASGDGTRTYLGGLKQWSADVEFRQDYAAGEVDATLFSLVGTVVGFKARADAAAVSPTNPSFEGNVVVTSYQPLGGSVGDAVNAPVSLQGSGALSRVTA